MFEVTNAMTTQTIGIHIDRAATLVQSAEEDADAGIVSDSVMTSERELNREVDIMDWNDGQFRVGGFVNGHYWRLSAFCLSS